MHTKQAKKITAYKSAFRRDLLPSSNKYYLQQGLVFIGGGKWRSCICPFHKDKVLNLRVHLESGAFRCMACGVHGGDVLAFHKLRYELNFSDAARDLGAWEAQ